MKSLPAWAIPISDQEDHEEARKAYLRRRAGETREIQIRQSHRRIRVREIEGASIDLDSGEPMILGEPWFYAWLTTATFLAVEGRFHEIKPPQEWLAKKISEGL